MKKLTMICMSALLMLAVSCKKDKKDEIENAGSGFRATVESHEGTGKTHLDDKAVKWNSGDAILVKSSTCPEPIGFTTQGSGSTVNFDANETLPADFYAPPYTGYYPADMFEGDQLTLPATQQYDENNTFANGANPMAATSNETLLPFKNICGVLKLQLYGTSAYGIDNITITSNEGEQLWGTGTVTLTGGIPSLGTLSNGGSTLTLNCGGAAMSTSESAPTAYYFVVPVNTLGTSFTVKVTDSNGKVWTKTANAPQNSIVRSKITMMPELAVTTTKPIEFTVDANGTKVKFSPGNLQYLGKSDGTGTWRFAEHQWDYMGDGPASGTTKQGNVDLTPLGYLAGMYNTGSGSAGGSETDADKAAARDLFGWGCTGFQDMRKDNHSNWYQTNYMPYSTSRTGNSSGTDAYDKNRYGYGPDYVSSPYYNLTVENKSDWGCVTGLPSAGEGKSWRTLSKDEWVYLLNTDGSSGRTDANRFAKARVSGVAGLLIFPDGYELPSGYTTYGGGTGMAKVNGYYAGYPTESIPGETWTLMESAGVVFLPAAGGRYGTSVVGVGSDGTYWSSSYYSSGNAYRLIFVSGNVIPYNDDSRCYGYSVRLVSEN